MDSDIRAPGPHPMMAALVIVFASGLALGLSFFALSHVTGQWSVVSFIAASLGLCVFPGLVVRSVRNWISLFTVACVVSTSVFCLATVYGLHCRYFLGGSPPGLLVLVAVLASGIGWIVLTLGIITLVIVPPLSITFDGIGAHLLLGIPVAVRWLALIVLPFLFIWLSPPFFVFVLAVPLVAVLLELTGNSLLLGVLRQRSQATSPAVQRTLQELARETDERVPAIVQVGAHWPPMCQVRLGLPATPSIIVSDQVLNRFSDTALRAVLAHEWAHIRFRHLQTRIAFDALVAGAVVAGVLPVSVLLVATQPGLSGAAIALYLFAATSARHLLMMRLSRRFERVADAFARETAGEEAVIEALNATEGGEIPEILSAFSTHDSMAARRRALGGSSA